jgi:hypothetical protein
VSPHPQRLKRVAEAGLRRSPGQRHPLAGLLLKCCVIGF